MWQMPFDNFDGELIYIDEGEPYIGEEELHVLFTPGHSPGSVCFYSQEHKFVIGGDVLFQGSVGSTDLPGGDFYILNKASTEIIYFSGRCNCIPRPWRNNHHRR